MIKKPFSIRSVATTSLVLLAMLVAGISACQSAGTSPGAKNDDSAAGTATALAQNAQSTILVQKAQAMATAFVETLNAPQAASPTLESPTPVANGNASAATPTDTPQTTPGGVEIVAVTTAADGAYIMVQFRAPARLVRSWIQGNVFVIDESTGIRYAEIPSVGTIGPLISRPKSDGQLGYVMLTNAPTPLQAGAIVTVILGKYEQEHLVIQ